MRLNSQDDTVPATSKFSNVVLRHLGLEDLFHFYLKNLSQVGEQAHKRVRKVGRERAICDYLAGMTDRYCMQEHERIFGPTP